MLLTVSQLLSRMLGFVRDAVIAARLGASPDTDAYFAAFTIPDLLNYLLAGGALSITFVPLYRRFVAEGREDAGWRLFSNVLTVMAVVLSAAIAVAWVLTPWLVDVVFPEFDAEQRILLARLTRIILPGPLFFVVGGLLTSVEVARQRFWAPAVAPLIYNACIIAGGLLLEPRLGVAGFSWGVLAGAALGPFLVPLILGRGHVRYRPHIDLKSPELRRYVALALPLMVGVSLVTVDEWLGRYFAQGQEGAITWLNNARRLMLVPVALVGQSIGQAALPFLAQYSAEGDDERMHGALRDAIRGAAALATVAAGGVAVTAWAAVALVFERGAYSAMSSTTTGSLLALMSPAIISWSVLAVVLRGFYAREDTLRPMLVNTVTVVLVVPIYAVLASRWQAHGLAAATSIGMTASCAATMVAWQRVHGTSAWGALARGVGGGLAAAVPAAAAAAGAAAALGLGIYDAGGGAFFVMAPVYVLVALPLLLRFGGPAADAVRGRLGRLLGRLKNRTRPGP